MADSKILPDRVIVDPPVTPESQAFWDASAQGKLLIKKCPVCGKFHWYPRDPCPFCDSPVTDWVEASGKGTIYTHSFYARAKEPYIAAYVTLDEGPTMFTNIVDCNPATVKIGQKVEVTFKKTPEGFSVPMFKQV